VSVELISRYFWTLLLLAAGLSHFLLDEFLVAQMPGYFEEPKFWVHTSGVAELILAAMLHFQRLRRIAWLLIALMCAIYLPVHWHVATECSALETLNGDYHIPCWLAWVRLPVQFGFIVWAGWLSQWVHLRHPT
jgi:uncharacterized membrane protein